MISKDQERGLKPLSQLKKILRYLPDSRMMKVTIIEKLKDLSKMVIDELIESLLIYEMKRKPKLQEVKAKRYIALKVVDMKEEKRNSSMDKDDVSLLTRKFSKFLLRSKRNKRKGFARTKGNEDGKMRNNEIICYECKKLGHIR